MQIVKSYHDFTNKKVNNISFLKKLYLLLLSTVVPVSCFRRLSSRQYIYSGPRLDILCPVFIEFWYGSNNPPRPQGLQILSNGF